MKQNNKTDRFKENIKNKTGKMWFLNLHLTLQTEIIIEPKSVLILELK
jgi:hypothetical protein